LFHPCLHHLCSALVLGACIAVAATTPKQSEKTSQIEDAWYRGELVEFHIAPLGKGERPFRMGPWDFGPRVNVQKPQDTRLNLYLVAPGYQHQAAGFEEYDHNDIINDLPPDGKMREWDVYWALILDPRLQVDIQDEHDLLLYAQESFTLEEFTEFDEIPSSAFLMEFLDTYTLEGLKRFERVDGQLPRLVIVPAGFAVRASVQRPAPPEAEDEAESKTE
jgi:hypothetical protein